MCCSGEDLSLLSSTNIMCGHSRLLFGGSDALFGIPVSLPLMCVENSSPKYKYNTIQTKIKKESRQNTCYHTHANTPQTHAYTYTYLHTHTHARTYTYPHAPQPSKHQHPRIHTHMHSCSYTHSTHAYINTPHPRMHTYTRHTCMHTQTHTPYTHKCTHTHTHECMHPHILTHALVHTRTHTISCCVASFAVSQLCQPEEHQKMQAPNPGKEYKSKQNLFFNTGSAAPHYSDRK